MKKISIFNIKGGVAKTTTAVNLASGLARKGKKVLLLDMDAQGNINTCLSGNDSVKDMYHLIANGAQLPECIVHMGENLDCVTSRDTLNTVDMEMSDRANADFILSNKLEKLKGYDYIIMDCPPHFGTMTRNALFFSDEVYVPVSADILGFTGLKKTMELIEEINKHLRDDKIVVGKVIPTIYDKRLRMARKIMNLLQNEYYGVLADPIRVNSKLREAPQRKRSIFAYAKNSTGARDYGKLADEVIRDEADGSVSHEHLEMETAASEMMDSK